MKLAPFFLITIVMSLVISSIAYSDNYALQFDGQDDYVACDSKKPKNLPEGNAPRTEEAWFKTTSAGGLKTIMGYGNNSSNQMLNILVDGAMITISQWGARLDVKAPINDGEWHHVAVVHDGKNTQTVYIDGEAKEPKGAWSLATVANFCKLGCRIDAAVEFFPGVIDEVRIWSVTRTEKEIKGSMKTSLKGDEPGLVGYWKFDEGSGETTADATGNNDGKLVNGPKWVESDAPVKPYQVDMVGKLSTTWGRVKSKY